MLPQPAMGQVRPADGADGPTSSGTCPGFSLAAVASVKAGVEVSADDRASEGPAA